jgi:plasmid maintenance system antidote protein VapI
MMAYLYRHIRLDKNEPFYIGIGSDDKYQRANSKSHRNNHWRSIVSKTEYEVQILCDDVSYEYAKEKEIEFIDIYKRKEDKGTLCNITKGGDGILGLKHTEESKRKMGEANKGKEISEWHKKRISEIHTGKVVTAETRLKMSEKALGEKNPRYGVKVLDSTKEKMRDSAKKGEFNSASKLTAVDVLKIRELNKLGISQRKIAAQFGVQKTTIAAIINKITWKHI